MVINVTSSNVTIEGMDIDGNNLSSSIVGENVNGVDVNAGYGIYADNSAPATGGSQGLSGSFNHLNFQNNVFQDLVYQGVWVGNTFGTDESWNYIDYNAFNNMKEGVQTYALHADISHNTMTNVVRGISIHGTNTAADTGFTDQITDNNITLGNWTTTPTSDTSRGVGIWVNYQRDSTSPLTVSDNTITMIAAAPAGHTWYGIYGLTIDGGRTVNFNDNTINGNGYAELGYYFSSVDTPNVTINGGTISGTTEAGVLVTNWDSVWSSGIGENANVTVSGVSIHPTSGAGVEVYSDPAHTTPTAQATITGSTITGTSTGVLVSGAEASATITNDTITGNGTGVDVDGGTALLQGNDLTSNTIGLLIDDGGIVDAGQTGKPAESNFTGLGESTGGNNFSSYTAAATSSSGAIVDLNADSVAGPRGVPADATAFGNTWNAALTTPAEVGGVIYDDVQNNDLAFVDYANLGNLQVSVNTSSINEGQSVTLSGSFTDDPQAHTVTINWGDGTSNTVLNLTQGTFTIPDTTHTYAEENTPGQSYPVTVTVATVVTGQGPSVSDNSLAVTVSDAPPDGRDRNDHGRGRGCDGDQPQRDLHRRRRVLRHAHRLLRHDQLGRRTHHGVHLERRLGQQWQLRGQRLAPVRRGRQLQHRGHRQRRWRQLDHDRRHRHGAGRTPVGHGELQLCRHRRRALDQPAGRHLHGYRSQRRDRRLRCDDQLGRQLDEPGHDQRQGRRRRVHGQRDAHLRGGRQLRHRREHRGDGQ